MGLDMYLEVRKTISKYDYSDYDRQTDEWPPPTSTQYEALGNFAPAEFDKYADFAPITVSYPIGYWRKANAIHGWFVSNVQGGNDNCGSYYISREQLADLRDACESVLKVPVGISMEDAASNADLLPTQGFFFGSYEMDGYYVEDLKMTIEIINHALSVIPDNDWDWSFYYSSSW